MDAKRAANIARFKLCIEREMNGGGYTDENEQEAFWAMATNALEKAVPKSPKEKNLDFGDKVIVCQTAEYQQSGICSRATANNTRTAHGVAKN